MVTVMFLPVSCKGSLQVNYHYPNVKEDYAIRLHGDRIWRVFRSSLFSTLFRI